MRNGLDFILLIGCIFVGLGTVVSQDVKTTMFAAGTNSQQNKYAQWNYDENTHCLTIRGNGETHNDAEARNNRDDMIGKFDMDDKIHTSGFDSEQWEDVKEVIIEPGVTAVNTGAFALFTNLEKVTIPDSVKKMGAYVFYECESLKEVTIPDSVYSIDVECFYGCKSLEKIVFGKNVKKIGNGNFAGCNSLRKIIVRPGNENLITKNGILYHKQKKILYYAYGNSKNVTIPKGTKKIGTCAFFRNPKLQKVKIPASVTTIGGGAFYGCKNLKKVTFAKQSQCKVIKDYTWYWDGYGANYGCFLYCDKLTEMILPESLKYIGMDSFYECNSLRKIYFGKSFEGYYGFSPEYNETPQTWFGEFIGEKSSLKEIAVSKYNKYFTTEGGVLFDKAKTKLYIYPRKKPGSKYIVPMSVKTINDSAFYRCRKLKSLYIYKKDVDINIHFLSKSKKYVTLYGRQDSTVQEYAKKWKVKFVAI